MGVLKPEGYIIITGEQIITKVHFLTRLIKKIVRDIYNFITLSNQDRQKMFKYSLRDLFPSDQIKGDTHYTLKMVRSLAERNGFVVNIENLNLKKKMNLYIFYKKHSLGSIRKYNPFPFSFILRSCIKDNIFVLNHKHL